MLAIFAAIQLASDAFYAPAGPQSLAARAPIGFGLAVYRILDRVAPAAYVEDTLASYALRAGDLDSAQHHAVRMPAGPRRDDLLGQIASARGQTMLAMEYYFVAADVDRMETVAMDLARVDAPGALNLERRFRERLIALQTHPGAVAESYYVTGNLSNWLGKRDDSRRDFEAALAIAPLDMKYVLSAANENYVMGDYGAARRWFAYGLTINPASADMLGGLGLVAVRTGNRALARSYAARARAIDPHSLMLAALDRALR